MALNPTALAAAIKSALDGQFGVQAHAGGDADRQAYCNILAAQMIAHYIASTQVIHPMGPGRIV